MAGIRADDVHASFAADHLTVFADPFYACADFHRSCSQNSGFIKARQYRNESHIPTRAIFLRNAFFRIQRFEMELGLVQPSHHLRLYKRGAAELAQNPLFYRSKSDPSAFFDCRLNPGFNLRPKCGEIAHGSGSAGGFPSQTTHFSLIAADNKVELQLAVETLAKLTKY